MRKPFRQDFPLTQGWGENPQIYAQFGLKGHNGLDYGVPDGTDILAPHSGTVLEVSYDQNGYGTYIKIENDKEGSVLAHLKESHVSVGSVVTEGQLIAKSDNTGFSTGAHLHWGYYKIPRNRQDGYLGFINQLPLLQVLPPPESSIEDLKRKIEDLKQTEIRLQAEKAALQKEMEGKLALVNQTANDLRHTIEGIKLKLLDIANNL